MNLDFINGDIKAKFDKDKTPYLMWAAKKDSSFRGYTADEVAQELEALGFKCTDSKANFIFASSDKIPAAKLYEELRKRNILIRYFKKAKIDNYLRITVGSAEEMQAFTDAVAEIMEENK
jgi:histidinol-phosphate/aromatic aminotransferase/cobyric acid decarboxylase-like protein